MSTMADLSFPEFNESSVSALDLFDENAAYESEELLQDPDPTLGPDDIDLRRFQNDQDGAVRSYYAKDESGPLIYSKDRSDYRVTVERLLWLDGYRKTTAYGVESKHEDAMTLVVLKLVFDDRDTSRIGFAEAELRFQSNEKTDPDPEVKAWGPFRRLDRWNSSTAQRTVNSKLDVRFTGGGAGQELSAGSSHESGLSWGQIDFDQGTSAQVHNKRGQPHGVRWKVHQNRLHKKGLTREVRIAVLLARTRPSEPYKVTFRLVVHTGTLDAWKEKSQALLGMPGGKEVKWLAEPKPDNKDRCYAEGQDIIKSIDTENFEKLIQDTGDSTNLNAQWLYVWNSNELPVARNAQDFPATPGPDRIDPVEDAAVAGSARANEGTRARMGTSQRHVPASSADVIVDAPPVVPHASHGPVSGRAEPLIGINPVANLFQSPPGVDHQGYCRLVYLEARTAQVEARLAAQDSLILKLQQSLAKMEQLVSASIHPA